jgi:glycosyltransferase involved in cell wall biosynthesis
VKSKLILISIVIPFYNSARFLRETLNSVEKQVYPVWECLVVDDGSTDESVAIVKEFQQKDARFRYIRRSLEPKGASSSRNEGISQSRGEFLMFLDADDILSPDCLDQRLQFLEQHPSLDFAVFQGEMFGLRHNKIITPRKDYLEAFVGFNFAWNITSPLWKKEFFNSLGGFNTELTYFEDPELHIRALLKSPNFKVLTDTSPDMFYRQWKPYSAIKSSAYEEHLSAFAYYLGILPGLIKPSHVNIKILRTGIFSFMTMLIPPVEDWECVRLNNLLDQARKDGILGPIRYRALKSVSYLLKTMKSRSFHRLLLLVMQLITSPSRFVTTYGDALKNKIKPKQKIDTIA